MFCTIVKLIAVFLFGTLDLYICVFGTCSEASLWTVLGDQGNFVARLNELRAKFARASQHV